MVQGVDKVPAKCEPKTFLEVPSLRNGQINIREAWSEQGVPASNPEHPNRVSVRILLGRSLLGHSLKCCGVEPAVQSPHRQPFRQVPDLAETPGRGLANSWPACE